MTIQERLQSLQEPGHLPSSTTMTSPSVIHSQFSHLYLSTASSTNPDVSSSTSSVVTNEPSQISLSNQCTSCGNPMKNPSSSSSSLQYSSDPAAETGISQQPKKPHRLFSSSAAAITAAQNIKNYLCSEYQFSNSSIPSTHKTDSELINLSATKSPEIASKFESPSPFKCSVATQLPPLPPLARSTSDPSPFWNTTPPRQNTAPHSLIGPRMGQRSPTLPESGSGRIGDESPAKRLRKMSDRVREMRNWIDELVRESDDDGTASDAGMSNISSELGYYSPNTIINNEEKNVNSELEVDEGAVEHEAIVSTQRDGDAIKIHYKCPCGAGCDIRVFGQDIYYKLV